MTKRSSREIEALLRDGRVVDRAMAAARRRLVREHRLRGLPLVVWRDGRVLEVSPFSIELSEEEPPPPPR